MRSLHDTRYGLLLRRLRAARRAAGLTQAEVASAVKRPQSFISKCEAGERRVDVVELLEFASLYDKPLAFFVGEGEGLGGASVSNEGRPNQPPPRTKRTPTKRRR